MVRENTPGQMISNTLATSKKVRNAVKANGRARKDLKIAISMRETTWMT